jgi:hypothetical protein
MGRNTHELYAPRDFVFFCYRLHPQLGHEISINRPDRLGQWTDLGRGGIFVSLAQHSVFTASRISRQPGSPCLIGYYSPARLRVGDSFKRKRNRPRFGVNNSGSQRRERKPKSSYQFAFENRKRMYCLSSGVRDWLYVKITVRRRIRKPTVGLQQALAYFFHTKCQDFTPCLSILRRLRLKIKSINYALYSNNDIPYRTPSKIQNDISINAHIQRTHARKPS